MHVLFYLVPYQAFETSDKRHVVVGAGNDVAFKTLCKVLQMGEQVSESPKFATNALRVKHRKEIIDLIQQKFIKHSSDHWERVFANVSLPFGKVNSISEAMNIVAEHNEKSLLKIKRDSGEQVTVTGPAVAFSGDANGSSTFLRSQHNYPPVLGENTFQVLKSEKIIDCDEKLANFHRDGVIFQADSSSS